MKSVSKVIILPYIRVVLNLKNINTKIELKKIFAEFKNTDEAIKSIIEMYQAQKQKPKFA